MYQLQFDFEHVSGHYRRPWGSYGRGEKSVYITPYRRRKRFR